MDIRKQCDWIARKCQGCGTADAGFCFINKEREIFCHACAIELIKVANQE